MKHVKKYTKGGKKFPDLNGDGKVTMADVLKGRGVKKGMKGMKYEMGGKHDPKRPEAKADPRKAPKVVSKKSPNPSLSDKAKRKIKKITGSKGLFPNLKYGMGGSYDPRKVAMMKGLEAKIKKAKGTPEAKALVAQYRKITGTK